MTGMWLVCLSLLVAADAASIAAKPVDIPVQVLYDDVPQVRQLSSLKNLDAKPQLSAEEKVEADVLHIPEVIAKISQPVQDEVINEDASSQSLESSEEKLADAVSVESSSSSEESNEIESNNIENLKLKLENPEPAEEIQVAEEAVVLEADAPQVQEVVVQENNVKFVPVQASQDSIALKQASSTTAAPLANRPILGFINRLGETIGNTINSIRPQAAAGSTQQPPVAPAEAPQVSEEGLPIAAATAEQDPSAPAAAEAASSSTVAPTLINNIQQNINTQLSNFGNRVNGFIDNLRPKAPAGSQNEEEATTPNTPVINGIQNQFNNGLESFSNTVNTALNFFNQNQNATQNQSDEPQNNNPIQTILNGAQNFQQNFVNFVTGQNPNQQQGDEASPGNNATNIGQLVQVFQNGFSSILSNFRPEGNGSQSDEAAPAQPANPVVGWLGSIGQQVNNFINGGQQNNSVTQALPGIPSQLPGQLQNFTPSGLPFPGADQIQNITSQFSGGVQQFQNFTPSGSVPGLGELPGVDQIPGVGQFQPPGLPGLGQLPGVDQILPNFPQLPANIPPIPGVAPAPVNPDSPAAQPSSSAAAA